MLPLPQTAEYALRAVCYIAEHEAAGPVTGPAVARALGAPANYLSKLLHQLGQLGVLASVRGAQGGYRLGVPPDELHLATIVKPFLPKLDKHCIMGHKSCPSGSPLRSRRGDRGEVCGAHQRWKAVQDDTTAFFAELTIGDLLASQSLGGGRVATERLSPRAKARARPILDA